MALTIPQKSDVRRHLDYPAVGLHRISPAGGSLMSGAAGYRFFQAFGFLEYKLNNLMPDEESRLMGLAYGAVALMGVAPGVGDQISVVISNGSEFAAQTLTVTAVSGDTGLTLVAKLAALAAQNSVLTSAGFIPVAPYGTGPFSANVGQSIATPIPEVSFVRSAAFTIAATSTGAMGAALTATGQLLPPNATVDLTTSPATVLNGYIPILNFLEGAIGGATQNLDTAKADVWTARPTEIEERQRLYRIWQRMLSGFLGVPVNPNKNTGGRQSMALV